MYSYFDENFIMNSEVDTDLVMYYYNEFMLGNFSGVINESFNIVNFMAALDEYIMSNPQQIDVIIKILGDMVRNFQNYNFVGGLQHMEVAPRILNQKKLQYEHMKNGKTYESHHASLEAQKIHLYASYDVALEMELDDVSNNIEHDMKLIDLRQKIEFLRNKVLSEPKYQQSLESLQKEYDEMTTKIKR